MPDRQGIVSAVILVSLFYPFRPSVLVSVSCKSVPELIRSIKGNHVDTVL